MEIRRAEKFNGYSEDLLEKRKELITLTAHTERGHNMLGPGYIARVGSSPHGRKIVLRNNRSEMTIVLTGKRDLISIKPQEKKTKLEHIEEYHIHKNTIAEKLEAEEYNSDKDRDILQGIVEFLEVCIADETLP